MKNLTIDTENELLSFLNSNPTVKISTINGIKPLHLEVTSKHATYYDIEKQSDRCLFAPFILEICE